MTVEIKVPRLAESISEAVLVQWLKQDGERVRTDEPIATLETDKAAVELPADSSGVLRHARKVGETVTVGDVIARIEESEGAEAKTDGAKTPPTVKEKPAPAPAPAKAAAPAPKPQPVPAKSPAPAAAKPAPVPPPAAAKPAPAPPSVAAMPAPPPLAKPSAPPEAATLGPAVRRMVEELGLDPARIPASGPGGRLLKEDVQRFVQAQVKSGPGPAAEQPASPSTGAAPAAHAPPSPGAPTDWAEGEEERAVPMSRLRRRIAERLIEAQQTAAILTTFNEVDMTAVIDLRARFKESFEARHGVRLSFMSFFGRACVLALQQIPQINAEIRGADIVYKRHVHLGVAVQTPRGLVVPIVHHADSRGFGDLEREIARLATAARDNRLSLDELSGGTFTVSNGGVFGSLLSTPILNPPQSGILGMHKIEKRPVVVDDQIVIRPMMYLALSYDHRIVDGEQAVTFLVSVKQRLEDPERMLLDV